MPCICASAYAEGLGSGTPEYTHWNVMRVCVLSRQSARNVFQTHCNNFKGHDQSVCELWVTAGDGCMLRQGVPGGLSLPAAYVHIYYDATHTHTHTSTATCLSPSQHGSKAFVLIGVCFVSARKSKRVSPLQSMLLSFFLVGRCWSALWHPT